MNPLARSRKRRRKLQKNASRRVELGIASTIVIITIISLLFAPHSATSLIVVVFAFLAWQRLQRYRPSRPIPVDTYHVAKGSIFAAILSGIMASFPAETAELSSVSLIGVVALGALLPKHGAFAAATISALGLALCAPDLASGIGAGMLAIVASGIGMFLRHKIEPKEAISETTLLNQKIHRSFGMKQDLVNVVSRSVAGSQERILTLLRSSLRAQTAIVLQVNVKGEVRIQNAETCVSNVITQGPFSEHSGILEILHKQSTPYVVGNMEPSVEILPWYEANHCPAHVMAVGLYDAGLLVGFLVVDRVKDQDEFCEADTIALQAAADELLSNAHAEQLVNEAERARTEMTALYRAAEAFNSALTPDEVCEVAKELVQRFVKIDMLTVTSFNEETERQTVLYSDGYASKKLFGHEFGNDESLASLSLRYDDILPYSGTLARRETSIFGESISLSAVQSLAIFPLKMGQRQLGTFTIGAFSPNAFPIEQREELQMIIHYAASALSNALAYSGMVKRATTDGMTGLTNHRTFKERGAHALARAERSGRPLSLIMLDIDHFKRVNDTFGHATGDIVIKRIASMMHASLRKIDIGARYGGEEFAIVLEDTPVENAAALAERLRIMAENTIFNTEDGRTLQVTLSLGVATFPAAATQLSSLIETADQALYRAKNGGRNRVVRFDDPAESSAA